MKKVILAIFIFSLLFVFSPAFAASLQWTDLPVGVDANGNVTTTHVYGYYTDIEGFGQVFVVCNPNTGQETGETYVPNVKIGEKQGKKIVGYERKLDLDWDHPKQVQPVQVTVFAPNIPWSTEYDWDYYEQTGQLREKAVNDFKWSRYTDYSFARLVPGDDPDYWLIVASITNPNPFPVRVDQSINVRGWYKGWWSGSTYISKEYKSLLLGPNETKHVLLNRGRQETIFADELGTWDDNSWHPGASTAYYNNKTVKVEDPDYWWEVLASNGTPGFYVPYVRWDGTDPVVKPLIPMRLAYNFHVDSYSRYGNYWYGYYRGREFPEGYGHAEYDPTTGQWSIGISFSYFKKPDYMSDAEWQKIYDTAVNKAISALKPLFEKWYPKVPYLDSWWDEYMYVNPDTGEIIKDNSPKPDFYVYFSYLEPVPPNNAPPASQGWWDNTRWGGWLYTTWGPYSSGYELPAPVLVHYSANREYNWTRVHDCQIPQGTYFTATADPRYYDTDWMNCLPVLKATPMFIEKYAFHATDGDFGYLTKEAVPGYLLWVSSQSRPVINTSDELLEITAKCADRVEWRNDGYYKVSREWKWTPAGGWQLTSENWGSQKYWRSGDSATWEVMVKHRVSFTGRNPMDAPVSWHNAILINPFVQDSRTEKLMEEYAGYPWESLPNSWEETFWQVYRNLSNQIQSGKTTYLNDALLALADMGYKYLGKQYSGSYDSYIDTYAAYPRVDGYSASNFGSSYPVGTISLNPGETKTVLSQEGTVSVRFTRSGNYSCADVLNQISGSVQAVFQNRTTREAVFDVRNGWTYFLLGKTFEPGKGGIVTGAQKYLIHREWVHKRDRWGDYYWGWDDDYTYDKIGFPNAPGITLSSYLSYRSPTDGQIVKANDALFTGLASPWASEEQRKIVLGYGWSYWQPVYSQYWRCLTSQGIYPPDYPHD